MVKKQILLSLASNPLLLTLWPTFEKFSQIRKNYFSKIHILRDWDYWSQNGLNSHKFKIKVHPFDLEKIYQNYEYLFLFYSHFSKPNVELVAHLISHLLTPWLSNKNTHYLYTSKTLAFFKATKIPSLMVAPWIFNSNYKLYTNNWRKLKLNNYIMWAVSLPDKVVEPPMHGNRSPNIIVQRKYKTAFNSPSYHVHFLCTFLYVPHQQFPDIQLKIRERETISRHFFSATERRIYSYLPTSSTKIRGFVPPLHNLANVHSPF